MQSPRSLSSEVPAEVGRLSSANGLSRAISNYTLLATFFSVSGIAGALAGSHVFLTPAETPLLKAQRNVSDLGELWEQPQFTCSVTATNAASYEITIEEAFFHRGTGALLQAPLSIPPGGMIEVPFRLDMKCMGEGGVRGDEMQEWCVSVFSRDGLVSMEPWLFRAAVREAFSATPRHFRFEDGELVRGEIRHKVATVRSYIPLSQLTAHCATDSLTAAVSRSDKDRNAFTVMITPSERLPAGASRFVVGLEGLSEDGERVQGCPLEVEVCVVEDVRPIPASVVLGPVPVGAGVKGAIVLRSRRGRPFRLEAVRSPVDAISAVVDPSKAGEAGTYRTVTLNYSPTTAGVVESELLCRIAPLGREAAPYDVRVKVTGIGTSASQ